tara:strand:- start:171 stop:644 length:474 start_codon:yes stop_codon:yes gene_type:complete
MDKNVKIIWYPKWLIKSVISMLIACFILITFNLFSDTTDSPITIVEKEIKPKKLIVTATMYEPLPTQTDSTPNITADGTRISIKYAGKYRYLAVSRDLLDIVSYGDYVVIEGINGTYDGVWQVKDTMHPRWENRIDLLCNPGTSPFRKDSATLTIYN